MTQKTETQVSESAFSGAAIVKELVIKVILVNNKLDALFSMHLFISLLYMFRATCLA
jgi:hypothetical protein